MNFYGFCDDTEHIGMDQPGAVQRFIKKHLKGCEFVMTVKRKPNRQGTQSLRYLRGVVIPDIARACGYIDPEDFQDVYNGLMWKFFRLPDGPFGEPRRESCAKDQMPQERISQVIDTLITYAETSIPGCRIRRPDELDIDTVRDIDYDEEAA